MEANQIPYGQRKLRKESEGKMHALFPPNHVLQKEDYMSQVNAQSAEKTLIKLEIVILIYFSNQYPNNC